MNRVVLFAVEWKREGEWQVKVLEQESQVKAFIDLLTDQEQETVAYWDL